MSISFFDFIKEVVGNPILLFAVILTLGVITASGWMDAPNAIATCVATRCMEAKAAIIMGAICNFLGVFVMTMVNSAVAMTMTKMVDFGDDPRRAVIALSAALLAIVLWSLMAWYFAIPSSESHALIAGLSGAAIALQGGFSGINGAEWMKVLYGLGLSLVLGFGVGFVVCKIVSAICYNMERRKADRFFKDASIASAAGMAFMHGAQDGQKYIGVLILGVMLTEGASGQAITPTVWMMALCSMLMALGTTIGGEKIIKSVGMNVVKLEKYQGFSADLAATLCLLVASFTGMPVSTTHTKTTAIMGVGAVKRVSSINFKVVKTMIMTWIITFPGCGLMGFLLAKLFLWLL